MRSSDRNPHQEMGLRRQESADATPALHQTQCGASVVPSPSGREGQNAKEDRNLSGSRDEQRKPTASDRSTAGEEARVKPEPNCPRVEPSPAPSEGTSNGAGEEVWERIWEKPNLLAALQRVETNGGAPGMDGMTVQELRPHLSMMAQPSGCAKRTVAGHSEASRCGNLSTESGAAGGDTETRRRDEALRNPDGGRPLYPAGGSTGTDDVV